MTSFINLNCVVLLIYLPWVGLAKDNSTSSPRDKNDTNLKNMTTLNLTNASAISCNLTLENESSAIENILRFMQNYTTHVVEIKVSINSGNKTRHFPELIWPWASEIGRTIISLVARFEAALWTSPTRPLTVGIEKVNVVVSEENYGCLPTGSKGPERVFDFLLHQLSHSDNTHNYKLCRAFNDEKQLVKQYNCCRVASGGKLTICAEYTSIAVRSVETGLIVFIFVIVSIGLPLIIEYLRSFPNDRDHYGITDSPMALSTIFHTLFIEGHGRTKSAFRRFLLWLTILTICILSVIGADVLYILLYLLIIPFTLLDIFSLHTERDDNAYNAYINSITLPFNIKFWWKILTLKLFNCDTRCAKFCHVLASPLFFLFVYIIAIYLNFSSSFYVIVYKTLFSSIFKEPGCEKSLLILTQLTAYTVLVWFIITFLNSTFLFIAAVYLNGEFYGPVVLPVIGLVVYFLKHWKSFVETKYLVLKTNTCEVCKELWENNADAHGENPEGNRAHGENHVFTVNVKDRRIPKTLYNMTREKILPYDKILFHFFARVFFVANFFLVVYVMMSLAQKSNISGPAQIISSLIVSTFPFFFDAIWAEDTFEQKDVNNKEQQRTIHDLMVLEEKTGNEIKVSIKTGEEHIAIANLDDLNLALISPIWRSRYMRPANNETD